MADKQEAESTETTETTTVDGGKGDETKVEVTVTTKAKGDETRLSDDTDLVTDIVTEDGEYKPLFDGEEEFDEAQLTGPETEKTPEEKEAEEMEAQKQAAEKEPDKEKQAAKESEEKADVETKAKEEAEAQAAKEKVDKKPPEGYVPHAALHEERTKRQKLTSEVEQLKGKIATIKAEKEASEPKMPDGLKILTDLELDELIEDDPQAAIRYQAKLAKHEKQQATVKQSVREHQREAESVVMTTVDRIEKAVPGIYDGEKTIAKDLADFAVESGFKDEAFLEVMTNPATVVIPAGTDKRILLSNGAASLIEMLHKIHTSSAEGKDSEKVRAEVTEELTKSLTETIKAEVTKDLLSKLKPEHVPSDYRSIEELPSSQDTPVASTKQYTEAEFARLSEEEQDKLLGG